MSNAPTGARNLGPLSIPINSGVDATQVITLASGANTITVPTGATVCVLLGPNSSNPTPNPTWGGTLTVKGVTGDTGVVISAKYPTVLSWDTAPSSFVVTASTTGATLEAWFA